jgi:lysyl-tRNA synthetase class 2
VRIRYSSELTPAESADLALRPADWRCDSGERGFSMALGRFGGPADPGYLLAEALDADGIPRALLGFVPWGPAGLSLDLMRRDRDCDNGLVEFMVTELFARCGGLGIERVSLNFAMFRSAFARSERIGAGPVLRGWCALLRLASRFWQVEQLYRANEKYRPIWTPRYLCYGRLSQLPRTAVAIAVAEGFLPVPGAPVSRPATAPAAPVRELAAVR